MIEIVTKNNKANTINKESQCHSSSNKPPYRKSILETILENNTTTDTVADSAATGHFFPNHNNSTNNHNQIVSDTFLVFSYKVLRIGLDHQHILHI
jgi:hypothetical protein